MHNRKRSRSRKQSKRLKEVEDLAFQVRRLANELQGVGHRLKCYSLLGEEVNLLLSELRAVRHLLDHRREFRHLDIEHSKVESVKSLKSADGDHEKQVS